ncbi:PilZ domain-containing protein [Thalassovita sp.]|uniref:PilZ domain-containing protein n=1 Tax=Thalassovita sp. TaxID=1979401 RepID=UPI0029DE70F7|nr:PilZ domain-containing protein [Thalassovita sp.]
MAFVRVILCMLLAAIGAPVLAAGRDCAVHDWLVQGYHLSTKLDQDHGRASGESAARALLDQTGTIPQTELTALLRNAGLQRHGQVIRGFLATQRQAAQLRLDSGLGAELPPETVRKMRQFSQEMQAFVANLRCEENPDWHPAPAGNSAAQGASAIQPRPDQPFDSPPATVPLRWLAIGLLALSVGAWLGSRLTRAWNERHRRRCRRFLCHLPCMIVPQGMALPGTVMDISQMGAKVYLGHCLPEEVKTLNILLPGQHIRARVAWRNAQFCGLAFKAPLDRLALHDLLRSHRGSKRAAGKNETAPLRVP